MPENNSLLRLVENCSCLHFMLFCFENEKSGMKDLYSRDQN